MKGLYVRLALVWLRVMPRLFGVGLARYGWFWPVLNRFKHPWAVAWWSYVLTRLIGVGFNFRAEGDPVWFGVGVMATALLAFATLDAHRKVTLFGRAFVEGATLALAGMVAVCEIGLVLSFVSVVAGVVISVVEGNVFLLASDLSFSVSWMALSWCWVSVLTDGRPPRRRKRLRLRLRARLRVARRALPPLRAPRWTPAPRPT